MKPDLIVLNCAGNKLTRLDISMNPLVKLNCRANYLDSLDISNNTGMQELNIENMPSLYKVCVWELPFPPSHLRVFTIGSPNYYYSTDCNN